VRPALRFAAPLVALVLAATATSCSEGDGGGDDEEGGTTAVDEATTTTTSEPACEDRTLGDRSYILCTSDERGGEQDLVVALHGRGSSAAELQAATELDRLADARGLTIAFPESLDGGWGDDTFTSPGRPTGDEDLDFLREMIRELRAEPGIADDGIGLVGFSNGASMALRYASQLPGLIGEVVAVAGQLPRDPAIRPTARVPLLVMYGTADPIRSYDQGIPDAPDRQPGDPTPTLPTVETVEAFVRASPTGEPQHEGPVESDPDPADGTTIRTERWSDGQGTLAVIQAVVGGGHTWPSARAAFAGSERFGPTSQDLDASAEALDFILD
jgi:polyhydroxybutyrate depolymerase